MSRIWQDHRGSVIALGIALLVALSCFVIVPETHQAVIIQAGRPDRVANRFEPNAEFGLV